MHDMLMNYTSSQTNAKEIVATGKNVLITGKPGSDKTAFIEDICEDYRNGGSGAQIEEKRDACSSRDLIRLGRYLQDYKEALGVKAIEWRVLARYKNGMILMTTKDAIAGRRFHEMENFISWEDCELRGCRKSFYR